MTYTKPTPAEREEIRKVVKRVIKEKGLFLREIMYSVYGSFPTLAIGEFYVLDLINEMTEKGELKDNA